MDLAQLADELEQDPEALGYAALAAKGDHAGIATLLNLADRPGKRAVSAKKVRRNLLMTGELGAIEAIARDPGQAFELRALGWTTLRAVEPGAFEDFDMTDAQVRAAVEGILEALVVATLVSDATRDLILAEADGLVSRAEELFGPGAAVRHEDVAAALGAK